LLSFARLIDLPLIPKKHQEPTKVVYHGCLTQPLQLELDRSAKTPLAEQIRKGTVRSEYEKLSAAQLIVASRATGTRVADRPPVTDASSHLHAPSTALQIAGAARPQQFGP
jgi:GntR family transcriptional regulator / MocR family aminotransferase